MADSRTRRRIEDPGLQPERTSLAWFRTLLGYGALLALALRHSREHAGLWFWAVFGVLALVALMVYRYARQRNLMDIAISDFANKQTMRARLLIVLAICVLALLFSATHMHRILLLIGWQ